MTTSFAVYAADSNVQFAQEQLVLAGGPTAGDFDLSGGNTVNLTDPFSLSAFITMVHGGQATSSIDLAVTVPEPGTLALLGLGFAGLGLASRRRRTIAA